jgi:peroxiredoxin
VKVCIAFLLFLFIPGTICFAQAPKKAVFTEKTIVKDSSGIVYPYNIWKSLLSTGTYILKAEKPQDENTDYLIVRLTEEQLQKKIAGMPRPPETKVFRTGSGIGSFSAKDINGNKYKLKDLKGKIVVLNFWFINCGPCRTEIPELNKLTEDYKDSSIVFLGIALDAKADLERFLAKIPFTYNIIDDGRYIASQYNVTAYPTHVILDKEGKVYFHTQGLGTATIHWIRKSIDELRSRKDELAEVK